MCNNCIRDNFNDLQKVIYMNSKTNDTSLLKEEDKLKKLLSAQTIVNLPELELDVYCCITNTFILNNQTMVTVQGDSLPYAGGVDAFFITQEQIKETLQKEYEKAFLPVVEECQNSDLIENVNSILKTMRTRIRVIGFCWGRFIPRNMHEEFHTSSVLWILYEM